MDLGQNVEPQKDSPVYGAFGSALFVFGRANGEAAAPSDSTQGTERFRLSGISAG